MSSSYFSLAFSLLTISIIAGLTVETNQEKVDTYNVLQRARRAPIWPFSQDDGRESVAGKAVRFTFGLASEVLAGPARIAKGTGNILGGLADGVLGLAVETNQKKVDTYNVLQRARRAAILPFFQEDRRDSHTGDIIRAPLQVISELLNAKAKVAKAAGNFFGGAVDSLVGDDRTQGGTAINRDSST